MRQFIEIPGGRLVRYSNRFGGEYPTWQQSDELWEASRARRLARAQQRDSLDQLSELLNADEQPGEECRYTGEPASVAGRTISIREGGVRVTVVYGDDGLISGVSAR